MKEQNWRCAKCHTSQFSMLDSKVKVCSHCARQRAVRRVTRVTRQRALNAETISSDCSITLYLTLEERIHNHFN